MDKWNLQKSGAMFFPSFVHIIVRSHTNPSFVCHIPYILVHCCYGRMVFQKSLWTFLFWSSSLVTRGWSIKLPKVSKSYFIDTSFLLKITWDNSCFTVGLFFMLGSTLSTASFLGTLSTPNNKLMARLFIHSVLYFCTHFKVQELY